MATTKKRIEAMDIVALQLYADSVKGTPEFELANKVLEDAKKEWREGPKCPHCGKSLK